MGRQSKFELEDRGALPFQRDDSASFLYYEVHRSQLRLEPETRLLVAILEDAVTCYRRYRFAQEGRPRKLFREAESWIFEDNADWPFSFGNICEHLALDAQYLRQGLLRENAAKEGSKIGLVMDQEACPPC